MNKLQAYVDLNEIKDQAAAEALGITRSAFVNLRTGKKKPSLSTARKIRDWSDGLVPMEAWSQAGASA